MIDMRIVYGLLVYFGIFFGSVFFVCWIIRTIEHVKKIKKSYNSVRNNDANVQLSTVICGYTSVNAIVKWFLMLIVGCAIAISVTLYCLHKLGVL